MAKSNQTQPAIPDGAGVEAEVSTLDAAIATEVNPAETPSETPEVKDEPTKQAPVVTELANGTVRTDS